MIFQNHFEMFLNPNMERRKKIKLLEENIRDDFGLGKSSQIGHKLYDAWNIN